MSRVGTGCLENVPSLLCIDVQTIADRPISCGNRGEQCRGRKIVQVEVAEAATFGIPDRLAATGDDPAVGLLVQFRAELEEAIRRFGDRHAKHPGGDIDLEKPCRPGSRSEERRGGKAWGSTWRSRGET